MKDSLAIKKATEAYSGEKLTRALLDTANEFNRGAKKGFWRLERLLTQKRRSHFIYDCPDGILDSSRFTRVVTNPTEMNYYKRRIDGEIGETCVMFVVDGESFISEDGRSAIASVIDTTIRMFEQASIRSELYGCNGKSILEYKSSFETWTKAKDSISLLLLLEPNAFDGWDTVLKTLILKQSRYFEANKILFFITKKPVNFHTYVYALRNKVKYEHFDVLDLSTAQDIYPMFLKKASEMFRLNLKL